MRFNVPVAQSVCGHFLRLWCSMSKRGIYEYISAVCQFALCDSANGGKKGNGSGKTAWRTWTPQQRLRRFGRWHVESLLLWWRTDVQAASWYLLNANSDVFHRRRWRLLERVRPGRVGVESVFVNVMKSKCDSWEEADEGKLWRSVECSLACRSVDETLRVLHQDPNILHETLTIGVESLRVFCFFPACTLVGFLSFKMILFRD